MEALADLEKENADLTQRLLLQEKSLASQQQALTEKQRRIDLLEELVQSLKYRQFGPSSEKHPAQDALFDEAEETLIEEPDVEAGNSDVVEVPAHTRQRNKRISFLRR